MSVYVYVGTKMNLYFLVVINRQMLKVSSHLYSQQSVLDINTGLDLLQVLQMRSFGVL
jgi:hypothetical protein